MSHLLTAFKQIRQQTIHIAAPLSAEDCAVQSMPDASPIKWHLAHTSWFFETFVLQAYEENFLSYREQFRVLFNSYYNGVGDKYPRPMRGLLTRPSVQEVMQYRENVDARMQALLQNNQLSAAAQELITLGLNHEQQHQELMFTDLQHLLSCNPLWPRYREKQQTSRTTLPLRWERFEGGLAHIGHIGETFCFDNELPRHPVYLGPFELASRLTTNQEFLAFIQAGGYEDPSLWLSEGWNWRQAQGRAHPLYWHHLGDDWHQFTLEGLVRLELDEPLMNVSYFEADAYARWAQARLPTEAEWEHAAALCVGSARLEQLTDAAWQWTQSSYAPYPGYRSAPGAVGEYNGKFMVNQYVLRGGSMATSKAHTRLSYRNFFPATACWQFSGIRLAKDS